MRERASERIHIAKDRKGGNRILRLNSLFHLSPIQRPGGDRQTLPPPVSILEGKKKLSSHCGIVQCLGNHKQGGGEPRLMNGNHTRTNPGRSVPMAAPFCDDLTHRRDQQLCNAAEGGDKEVTPAIPKHKTQNTKHAHKNAS